MLPILSKNNLPHLFAYVLNAIGTQIRPSCWLPPIHRTVWHRMHAHRYQHPEEPQEHSFVPGDNMATCCHVFPPLLQYIHVFHEVLKREKSQKESENWFFGLFQPVFEAWLPAHDPLEFPLIHVDAVCPPPGILCTILATLQVPLCSIITQGFCRAILITFHQRLPR